MGRSAVKISSWDELEVGTTIFYVAFSGKVFEYEVEEVNKSKDMIVVGFHLRGWKRVRLYGVRQDLKRGRYRTRPPHEGTLAVRTG